MANYRSKDYEEIRVEAENSEYTFTDENTNFTLEADHSVDRPGARGHLRLGAQDEENDYLETIHEEDINFDIVVESNCDGEEARYVACNIIDPRRGAWEWNSVDIENE